MFNVKILGGDTNQGPVGPGKDTLVPVSAVLFGIYANNTSSTTDYYIQVFDSATVPADGSSPELVFNLPHAAAAPVIQFNDGYVFNSGIYVCASTTQKTKTVATANDVILSICFRKMT